MSKVNRAAAEDFILKFIEDLLPGSDNTNVYKERFKTMSNKEFDDLMLRMKSGEAILSVVAPLFDNKNSLNVDRNHGLAKKWFNHSFYQKLVIHPDEPSGDTYVTNVPYMVIELPMRRQAQLLVKKLSVPEHSRAMDLLTGQPAGPSRAAKITYPEVQVLRSMGMDMALTELMKFRGGDIKGFNAMNQLISRDGRVSMQQAMPYASGVESTRTLGTYLTGMHLKHTL